MPASLLATALLGFITIRRTEPNGLTTSKKAQNCQELAPGVSYCDDLGTKGVDEVLDVKITKAPAWGPQCERRVEKSSQLLAHYTGQASLMPSEASHGWVIFDHVGDFTNTSAVKLGVGEMPKGLDLALEGLCEGTHVTITTPPTTSAILVRLFIFSSCT